MKVLLLTLIFGSHVFAQSPNDIEEATGLPDEPILQKEIDGLKDLRMRSYILLEASRETRADVTEDYFPNAEASLTLDYKKGANYFVDGIVYHNDRLEKTHAYVNQLGVRTETSPGLMFALGKERNRRSPGIIISPSDLLFSQSQLPGQREDRRGVWLGRASYQKSGGSYDLILLPVDAMDEHGWPDNGSDYQGTVLRTLQQYQNLDVSLSVGEFQQNTRMGFAAQYILDDVWKTYYEAGYDEKYFLATGLFINNVTQHLLGLSYEGSDDYGFKAEYFVSPDLEQQHAIFTVSAVELKNRFNLYLTGIKSLEDESFLTLFRTDYLWTDHLIAGFTATFIDGSRYFVGNFDERYQLDLMYTF